jgi:hypothetical protein
MQCPHGNQKNHILISKIKVDLYVQVSYNCNDFVRNFRQSSAGCFECRKLLLILVNNRDNIG